jgi:hypothetical protein
MTTSIKFIENFINSYRQKSSFVISIDGKVTLFSLKEEAEMIKKCEEMFEGDEPGYSLEEIRADGGMIIVTAKKALKKEVVEKIEPVIVKDEKLEKLKEKKMKK